MVHQSNKLVLGVLIAMALMMSAIGLLEGETTFTVVTACIALFFVVLFVKFSNTTSVVEDDRNVWTPKQ